MSTKSITSRVGGEAIVVFTPEVLLTPVWLKSVATPATPQSGEPNRGCTSTTADCTVLDKSAPAAFASALSADPSLAIVVTLTPEAAAVGVTVRDTTVEPVEDRRFVDEVVV